MLRTILIIGLLVGVSGADIKLDRLYKAVPTIANSEDVSPRTKHRYTLYFRAVEGFNAIRVSNKYKGNRTLYYYTSKHGFDMYTDPSSHNTIKIDRHGAVYMQYVSDKGRLGDWVKLNYKLTKQLKLGSYYTDKYENKYRVCEVKGSKLRVIKATYSLNTCKEAEIGHSTGTSSLHKAYYRDGEGTFNRRTKQYTYTYTSWKWITKY